MLFRSGLGQLEALAAGTPVVGRKIGGIAATILDFPNDPENGNGVLFTSYTGDAFFEAFKLSLQLEIKLGAGPRLLRNAALAKNDWHDRMPKYLALLQSLAGVLPENPDALAYDYLRPRYADFESIRPSSDKAAPAAGQPSLRSESRDGIKSRQFGMRTVPESGAPRSESRVTLIWDKDKFVRGWNAPRLDRVYSRYGGIRTLIDVVKQVVRESEQDENFDPVDGLRRIQREADQLGWKEAEGIFRPEEINHFFQSDEIGKWTMDASQAVYIFYEIDRNPYPYPEWMARFFRFMEKIRGFMASAKNFNQAEWASQFIHYYVDRLNPYDIGVRHGDLMVTAEGVDYVGRDSLEYSFSLMENIFSDFESKINFASWKADAAEFVMKNPDLDVFEWMEQFTDYLRRFRKILNLEGQTLFAPDSDRGRAMLKVLKHDLMDLQSSVIPPAIAADMARILNVYLPAGEEIAAESVYVPRSRAESRSDRVAEDEVLRKLVGLTESVDPAKVSKLFSETADRIGERLRAAYTSGADLLLGGYALAQVPKSADEISAAVLNRFGLDEQKFGRAADAVFSDALGQLSSQIEKGEIERMAPVVFFEPGMEDRIGRFMSGVRAAFEKRGDVTAQNYLFSFVAAPKDKDALLQFMKSHLASQNAIEHYVVEDTETGWKRFVAALDRKVMSSKKFSAHYSLLFGKDPFFGVLNPAQRKRIVRTGDGISAANAAVLMPSLAGYFARTNDSEINAETLRHALPESLDGSVAIDPQGGVRILVQLLTALAEGYRRIAASA